MSPFRRQLTLGLLSAVGATVCFSIVPVFLRYFTDPEYHLDLWTVNAVRYTTAAVFWFPFVLVLGRRFKALDPPPVQRSVWVAAALPALCLLYTSPSPRDRS